MEHSYFYNYYYLLYVVELTTCFLFPYNCPAFVLNLDFYIINQDADNACYPVVLPLQ